MTATAANTFADTTPECAPLVVSVERVPRVNPEHLAAFWRASLRHIDFKAMQQRSADAPKRYETRAADATEAAETTTAVVDAGGQAQERASEAVNVVLALLETDPRGNGEYRNRGHYLLAIPARRTDDGGLLPPGDDAVAVINPSYLGPEVGAGCFALAEDARAHEALAASEAALSGDSGKVPSWRERWRSGLQLVAQLLDTDEAGLETALIGRADDVLRERNPGARPYQPVLVGVVFAAQGEGSAGLASLYDTLAVDLASRSPAATLFRTLSGGENGEPSEPLDHTSAAIQGHIDTPTRDGRELFRLDPTQRRAVRAVLALEEGDIQAINGPPGSGKTSILRAVVASRWVRSALKGGPCPIVLACGATNQSVLNVLGAFQEAPEAAGEPCLEARWLPDLGGYGAVLPAASVANNTRFAERLAGFPQLAESRDTGFLWQGRQRGMLRLLDPLATADAESGYIAVARDVLGKTDLSRTKEVVNVLAERLLRVDGLQRNTMTGTLSAQDLAQLQEVFDNAATRWSERRRATVAAAIDAASSGAYDEEVADTLIELLLAPHAFHLAARYWEGRFLLDQRMRLLTRHPRNVEDSLRRLAMLMPCLVATLHSAPRYATLDPTTLTPDEQRSHVGGIVDLLIIDEAGQASPEIGGAIFALARCAAIVGDVRQLAPIWNHTPVAERSLARQVGLQQGIDDIVRARRSVATGSLLAAARLVSRWREPGDDGIALGYHYRCKPSIAEYCNRLAYGGRLIPVTDEDALFPEPAMAWVEVRDAPERVAGSLRNASEAREIAEWLVERWPHWQRHQATAGKSLAELVGILTPYRPQANLIRATLAAQFDAARAAVESGATAWPDRTAVEAITVGTVHSLQGEERPIICFSLTEGADGTGRSFVDRDTTLMNVAVSRAKQSFVVFAHPDRLFPAQGQSWGGLAPIHALGAYLHECGRLLYPQRIVAIEAGGKLATMRQILGKSARIEATAGALYTLPIGSGVDVERGCVPRPQPRKHAAEALARIREGLHRTGLLTLATDDDRMGEYIAWQVRQGLRGDALDSVKVERVRLGALTPAAVRAGFAEPDILNAHKVLAEATRDVADCLITTRFSDRAPDIDRFARDAGPELEQFRVHGIFIDGGKPVSPGWYPGRVTAAILSLLLEQARAVVDATDRARIVASIELGGVSLKGCLYQVDEARDTTDLAKAHALCDRLSQATLRPGGLPFCAQAYEPPPRAGTFSVLAEVWRRYRVLPWDAMDALQELYTGAWSDEARAPMDPVDPVEIPAAGRGHPPILPLDAALAPDQLKPVLTGAQEAAYKVVWDRMVAARDLEHAFSLVRLDCKLVDIAKAALSVRFEEQAMTSDPPEQRARVAALQSRWYAIADAKVRFHVEPAKRWELGFDTLLERLEYLRIGRPSTVPAALQRLAEAGLIVPPRDREPLRFSRDGLARAMALESLEPERSSPRFSGRLIEAVERIEVGASTPRKELGALLHVIAPGADRRHVEPRIWETLDELEAALEPQVANRRSGSLIGPAGGDAGTGP